ncbi:MAG TPA: hypothetical protein PLO47_00375 [Bacillota bacterium]|nr:hypothetical protein [Bacillota bacterium]
MRYILQLIYYCITFSLVCVLVRGRKPINILCFHPKESQERAFELGLTDKKTMIFKRNVILLIMALVMTLNLYFIIRIWNKAEDFKTVFYQALFFLQLWNVYDGIIMDKLWAEVNDFWMIPELKDMWAIPDWLAVFKKRLPYIPLLLLFAFIAARLFPLF